MLLFWLSVTGIFLNHTDDLDLAEQPLGHSLLLKLYGIEQPQVISYGVGPSAWLSLAGDMLYWNDVKLTRCAPGAFSAVAIAEHLILATCGQALLLLSDGQIAERLGASYGTPQPLGTLGRCDATLCMQSGSQRYLLDFDQLRWYRTESPLEITLVPSEPPLALRDTLNKQWLTTDVNWERLMLDLHAGRSFGLGPWLMDGVAILIMVLSLSGLGIWLAGRKRRR